MAFRERQQCHQPVEVDGRGKGLDKYCERMLSDKRMRRIVDYPKLYEGFPGVKIRGGISYFLWDREHNGPCEVQTIWDGQPTGTVQPLEKFFTEEPKWHEKIGDIHALLERVRIGKERSFDVLHPETVLDVGVKDEILALLKQESALSAKELATLLNKTTHTVERHIKELREQGRLRHVGSDKTGHWEVIEETQ